MHWKILLEVFPFLWECFFGKKMSKDEPPSTNGTTDVGEDGKAKTESMSLRFLKLMLSAVQGSKRIALSLIVMFFISMALNYHLVNRVVAITRDESNKEVVTTPIDPIVGKPIDEYKYYNHLINHLRTTYE